MISLYDYSPENKLFKYWLKHTLSGETLLGETFAWRNYSTGEIFVTKPKIRHFRPTKSFALKDFLFFLSLLDYGLQLKQYKK